MRPHVIEGSAFHRVYPKIVEACLWDGEVHGARGQQTYHVKDLVFHIPDVSTDNGCFKNMVRSTPNKYLASEFYWYLSKDPTVDYIGGAAKMWNALTDSQGYVNSNYGEKLLVPPFVSSLATPEHKGWSEWAWAYSSLAEDHDSRQAVMTIHRPEHHWRGNKDVPCTLNVTYSLRSITPEISALDQSVVMRSSDAWFGLTFDVPFFLALQRNMAMNLNEFYSAVGGPDVMTGAYTHHSIDQHVYERNADKLREALEYSFGPQHSVPLMDGPVIDPNGVVDMEKAPGFHAWIRANRHRSKTQ